jgi:hypothetical protein
MLSNMFGDDDKCSSDSEQPGVIGLGGWETCARLYKQVQKKEIQTMEIWGKQGKTRPQAVWLDVI